MTNSAAMGFLRAVDVPDGWDERTLADVCEFVRDGDWIETKDQGGDAYRLLQVSNIGVGRFIETGNFRFVARDTFDRLGCTALRPGDVLVARMPEPTGRAWWVDRLAEPSITAVDVAILRPRPAVADGRFLSCLLNSPAYLRLMGSLTTGTTRMRVKRRDLERMPIPLPELKVQRRIAGILGALDDSIELSRRMSETLEAAARALFKSWFVDFDPVRTKSEGRDAGLPRHIADLFPDRLVASSRGVIPDGWHETTVGEQVVNFDSRRVPVSGADRARRRGPYPYYGAAGVLDHVDGYLFDGVHVLVGEDGSVVRDDGTAVAQYVWDKFWVNNHAHVLQGRGTVSDEQLYLYFQFQSVAPYVTGAVQPKLSQGRMNLMPFLDAGEPICRAFAETVSPWFARLRSMRGPTSTLEALRDALLPKLISGELRVPDAERMVEGRT